MGILKNRTGKTVLLRADMDALPILESTNLDYASTKTTQNAEGKEVLVMHACRHDMHTTALLATATLLQAASSPWTGTLVCLFQPNEETARGEQAMIGDGFYTRHQVPIPDIVPAQHIETLKAGMVALRAGPILAAVDSFEFRVFGKGGHGARPDLCIDPIFTASYVNTRF